MRITLLLYRDIESNLALNFLARQLGDHSLSVFLSDRVGGTKGAAPASMLGQLRFVEQDLWNDLVFPSLAALSERRAEDRLLGFNEFERLGIPVQRIASVKTPEGLRVLRDSNPDLLVSIRFGRIPSGHLHLKLGSTKVRAIGCPKAPRGNSLAKCP